MINRLILSCIFIILIAFSGCKEDVARISGSLSNHVAGEYIFLDELKSDTLVPLDSVKLDNNGTFIFKLRPEHPSFYLLKLNNNNFLTMLVEPDQEILVNAHHDSLNYPTEVAGSEGTAQMAEYNKKLRSTIEKLKALNKLYEEKESEPGLPELMNALDSMAQAHLKELNLYTKSYIDRNISSLISLVALYQQVAPGVPVLDQMTDWKYFAKVDSSLFRKYPDYGPVATLHKQVEELVSRLGVTAEASLISGTVPEIILPTPDGDTISLSSLRGSVVLLDFWAAWCPPCRMESPNLVKAYDTYHKKGFEIFQVSLDKSRDAWIKGIQDDKLGKWIHVSDLQYWNSVVVPLYKIESIPANYLLDKNGRIIATNLRGAKLEEKLAEIFGQE